MMSDSLRSLACFLIFLWPRLKYISTRLIEYSWHHLYAGELPENFKDMLVVLYGNSEIKEINSGTAYGRVKAIYDVL